MWGWLSEASRCASRSKRAMRSASAVDDAGRTLPPPPRPRGAAMGKGRRRPPACTTIGAILANARSNLHRYRGGAHLRAFPCCEARRKLNLRKHGLDFADAEAVFAGLAFTFEAQRFDYSESVTN